MGSSCVETVCRYDDRRQAGNDIQMRNLTDEVILRPSAAVSVLTA